jgi:hypothetical protein
MTARGAKASTDFFIFNGILKAVVVWVVVVVVVSEATVKHTNADL